MNILEARRRTLGKGVYKKTVEGNPAIAQGSLARRYPGITMQGWTEQNGTPTPETPVPIVSAGTQNQETEKWDYEVKLTGANLFDYTDMLFDDGYIHSSYQSARSIKPFHVEEGKQYILVQKGYQVVSNDYSSVYFGEDDLSYFGNADYDTRVLSSGISYTGFSGGVEKRKLLTALRTCEITKCMVHGAVLIERYQVEEFGLLEYAGDINAPYEPYRTPQTVHLTSDRPLTKWDKLEKRNGQWGWVYKSAEIESYTDESVPGEYFSTTGQLSTGAQVWYETTTETFVPLTESEQAAMNELYTFRPTTVLSNDCECNMSLTYKTKKSMQSAPGGGILKADGVISEFIFPVKWNQVNKIVLKISGISSNHSIFVCGANRQNIWIGLNNDGVMNMMGLKKAEYNGAPENEIVDGKYHEMIFTFEKPVKDINISNIWDSVWSKNIIYHEIMFYDDDELLSDCVPYYKGAGYMLDKKNNVVIRATNPDDYEFA